MSEDIPIRRLTWVPRSCRGSRWMYGRWQDSASARQAGNVCESTCPEQVANSHGVPIDLGTGHLRCLILCDSKPQLVHGKRRIGAFRIPDGPPDRVSQVTPVRKRGETVKWAQLVVNRPLLRSTSVTSGGPGAVSQEARALTRGWSRAGHVLNEERSRTCGLWSADSRGPAGQWVGSGHRRLLPYKSIDIYSFRMIKNIPAVIRYRPAWTGRALSVIQR